MSSYTNQTKKPEEEILYTDGTATPTSGAMNPWAVFLPGGVLPDGGASATVGAVTGLNGATGGAVTPTASPTGTSGVLYTDGGAGASTVPTTDPYGYAEWLKGQSYQNAADTANRARQEAAANKQSAIVGADSAYQQSLSNYGANAENLASRGLTNSGYGEYLMGKNYATARAEKAAANAAYQGAMSDILYKENSAKLEADRLYTEQMIQLDEKKKTDAQSAYDALLLAAQSGTDISALQSDARWALISPEQQDAITAAASEVTRGKTFDEILRNITVGDYDAETVTSAPGWDTLTDAEKDQALDEIRVRDDSIAAKYAENRNTVIRDIKSGNYSQYDDDELDRMVLDKIIDVGDMDLIKQERTKAAISGLESAIDDVSGALSTTSGFNAFMNDINKLETDEIISPDEADSMRRKAIDKVFEVDRSVKLKEDDGDFEVKTPDTDGYTDCSAPIKVDKNSSVYKILDSYAKATRKVLKFDGRYYAYINDKWYDVSNLDEIKEYYGG